MNVKLNHVLPLAAICMGALATHANAQDRTFPTDDLAGPTPPGTNQWAIRQVWGSGTEIDSLDAAFSLLQSVGTAGFVGETYDFTAPEMNFGGGGIFSGDLPYPEAVTDSASWTGDDFVQLGILQLPIAEEGEYTFGVHSDDGFAMRIRGGQVVSVHGNGQRDTNDVETVSHPAPTGDSDTRAVYFLTNGTYRVEFLWYERAGGDNAELYFARGAFTNDIAGGSNWRLVGSNRGLESMLPPGELPGPAPVNRAWSIRYIFGTGEQIGDIPTVLTNLQAASQPGFEGVVIDTTNSVINYGSGGFIGNNLTYPEEVTNHPSWTGDDFIQLAIGNIQVPEAGDYTFGIHSDDGFAFRIRGAQVMSVSGNGRVDFGDPSAVVHPANTADSSTRAVYRLQQGVYRVEWFWWERGGGDFGELYAARGAFANDADTELWRLVGDNVPAQEFVSLGLSDAGISVVSSDPGGEQLTNWEAALADLEATAGPPQIYQIFDIGDPVTNPGVQPFPKNTSADDNDFALRATATLVVPTNGTYVVGFNSDDGAYLKITGQTFLEIQSGANAASVIEPADTLTCDCLTGDANTFATITLQAGTYPIEAGMFERDGGAYLRVRGGLEGGPISTLRVGGAGVSVTGQALLLTDAPPSQAPSTGFTSVARSGDGLVLAWTGTAVLESADSINGPWTPVAGATSPANIPITGPAKFYRLR
jgi:hypothetical protein